MAYCKKISSLIFIFLLTVVFSSCSVSLFPSSSSKDKDRPLTHGFWRSRDSGETWEYLTDATKTGWFPPINIYDFVTDPFVPGIVYALSDYGLWRTIDQGDSWVQVNKGMRDKGEKAELKTLIFNINNTNQMYTSGLFQGLGRVYWSDDQGEQWSSLYKELNAAISIVGIGVDAYNSNSLYAMSSDLGFKESFDGGQTWKKIRWLSDEIKELKGAKAIQYWANPFDINEMYFLSDRGIYRSLNRGATWEVKNNGLYGRLSEWDLKDRYIPINKLYFDTFHGIIYAASQQGIFESVNKAENWRNITSFLPVRIPAIHGVSFSQSSSEVIYFSTQDTVYRTFNKGQSWDSSRVIREATWKGKVTKMTLPPDTPAAVLVDKNNSNIIYLGVVKAATS